MEFQAARTLAFDLLALHGLKLPIRWSKAKRQLAVRLVDGTLQPIFPVPRPPKY